MNPGLKEHPLTYRTSTPWTENDWAAAGLLVEIKQLKAEIERLRAALEEIAHHYIDSELASREKRGMAQRALTAAK